MRKWRITVVIIVLLLVGAALCLFPPSTPEPVYGGRKLSEWVDLGYDNADARAAIRHMGTNALPLTLKWLQFEPSPKRDKLYRKMVKAPRYLRPRWLMNILDDKKRKNQSEKAHIVLAILGPKARPIAGDLLALSYNSERPNASYRAIDALGQLGTTGFPELVQIMKDPQHPHYPAAARVIGQVMESDRSATSAVPALVEVISRPNPDAILVMRASEALSYVPPDPQQFAVFSRLATNSNNLIRRVAESRLEDFHQARQTNASSFIPARL